MDLTMSELIGIIVLILGVAGVLFNNRRLRMCFILWMVSNALSAGIHACAGMWSLMARDAVFFVLAIEGWIKWGNPAKRAGRAINE